MPVHTISLTVLQTARTTTMSKELVYDFCSRHLHRIEDFFYTKQFLLYTEAGAHSETNEATRRDF